MRVLVASLWLAVVGCSGSEAPSASADGDAAVSPGPRERTETPRACGEFAESDASCDPVDAIEPEVDAAMQPGPRPDASAEPEPEPEEDAAAAIPPMIDADPCDLPEDEDPLCYEGGTACLVCEPIGDCDGEVQVSRISDPREEVLRGPIGICQPGTSCHHLLVNHNLGSQTRMFCQEGASCDFRIGADEGRACVRCEAGTTCSTRCTDTTDQCAVDCRDSSECHAQCTNPLGSCVVQCGDECAVSCANEDACFVLCEDGSFATHCSGDRYVCGGGC